jgi:hypothetical protein
MNDTCHRCGRPVADSAPCCSACVEQTRANLDYVAANAGDLETTLTRQDRVSSGTGGRASAETPLPINLHASDVGQRLRNTLTTWTRLVAEERGTTLAEAFPAPDRPHWPVCARAAATWCTHPSCRASIIGGRRTITNTDMASWLSERLGWIAHREWGPNCFDELSRVAVDLGRAIDSPPPMISLGTCDADGCDGELRAHQDAVFVKCPKCRESYDIAKRKDQLLQKADHLRRNAASIARILTAATGTELPVKKVYNWVQRGNLVPVGKDDSKRPLYSLGAARRLHLNDIQQAILKAAKLAEKETQAA